MSLALTADKRRQVMQYLGYPNVTSSGQPWPSLFPTYYTLDHIDAGAEDDIRRLLGVLRATEEQMFEAQTRLQVKRVGEIELRTDEFERLRASYNDWVSRLSGITGIPVNQTSASSSLNIPRRHV
jgi:hypothetical protein